MKRTTDLHELADEIVERLDDLAAAEWYMQEHNPENDAAEAAATLALYEVRETRGRLYDVARKLKSA